MKRVFRGILAGAQTVAQPSTPVLARDHAKYSQEALEQELARTAVSRLGVMTPMRDSVMLSTDIYTPKNAKGPLPTILWKTPYNEHIRRGANESERTGVVADNTVHHAPAAASDIELPVLR